MAVEAHCADVVALCWIEAHPGLAAWFQAFFSIAAIAIAIWIPWWTSRHEHARRQRIVVANALDAASVMAASIDAFAKAMTNAEMRRLFAETDGYPRHNFTFAEAALASVNLAEIEDIGVSRAFRFLALVFASALSDAAEIKDYADDDDDARAWVRDLRASADKALSYHGQIQDRVHPPRQKSFHQKLREFLRSGRGVDRSEDENRIDGGPSTPA